MISEIDTWRAANLLIRQHGTEAELFAAQRANVMLGRGDREGRLAWTRIVRRLRSDRCGYREAELTG